MEEGFNLIRRRTSDLVSNVQKGFPKNLPSMPQMPQMPNLTGSGNKESTMEGTWERIAVPPLPRSSHSLDIIAGNAYIFGGEIDPREPVDNDVHVVRLPHSFGGADYYTVKAKAAKKDEVPSQTESKSVPTPAAAEILDDVPLEDKAKGKAVATGPEPPAYDVPAPRVGHATATIGTRIFLYGGRGGPEMQPLEEGGRVWVYDTRSNDWTYLDPVPAVKGGTITPHPMARSYHCATSIERPRDFPPPASAQRRPSNWRERLVGDTSQTGIPQDPIVGNVAEGAVDQDAEGYGTFFVHGGCTIGGNRTNDLWAFDVRTRTWTELPGAPGPARGGSAICVSKSRLFRFGGFDGETEIGGQLDFLNLEVEMFDDNVTKGEVSIRARGSWQTILQNNIDASSEDIPIEPSQAWPAPRSVASLQALSIGGGKEYLVLALGERSPSSDGHAGAGQFHGDVWTFQVPPLGMTPASVTAAFMQAVGKKTGEGKWTRVTTRPYDDEVRAFEEEPARRGWFASAVFADTEESAIVFWGGLGEDNERLGDGWILRL